MFPGLALRRHTETVIDPKENYFLKRSRKFGNLDAILHLMCASGDEALIDHLTSSDKNAKYCTHDVVDEMVDIAKTMIQEKIIERVRGAGFFAVMADGTTDVFKIDQFCLVLRYYLDGKIYEDFLEFVNVSGKNDRRGTCRHDYAESCASWTESRFAARSGLRWGLKYVRNSEGGEIQNFVEVSKGLVYALRSAYAQSCHR